MSAVTYKQRHWEFHGKRRVRALKIKTTMPREQWLAVFALLESWLSNRWRFSQKTLTLNYSRWILAIIVLPPMPGQWQYGTCRSYMSQVKYCLTVLHSYCNVWKYQLFELWVVGLLVELTGHMFWTISCMLIGSWRRADRPRNSLTWVVSRYSWIYESPKIMTAKNPQDDQWYWELTGIFSAIQISKLMTYKDRMASGLLLKSTSVLCWLLFRE